MNKIIPTDEQNAIVDEALTGKNLRIQAFADISPL